MLESDDATNFYELMTTLGPKIEEATAKFVQTTQERLENKRWSEDKFKDDLESG